MLETKSADTVLSWDFPENSGGQIRGIADAGIETFNGDVLRALARETCQNSLDASMEDGPVRIEFVRDSVPTADTPGMHEIRGALHKSLELWKPVSSRAEGFIRDGLTALRGSEISVLRVSDYGTRGLSEPFSREPTGGWSFLTKVDGAASKGSGTGGSFGIGKNAPFSASAIRTVFYRTLNEEGEEAAQGIARLMSFPLGDGVMSSGFGYYGDAEWNGPVTHIGALEDIAERSRTGTDLFIYGFQGGSDWLEKMEAEILDNFLVAIWEGKLEVSLMDKAVQGAEPVLLSRATIGDLLSGEVAGASALTRGFYEVLSGDDETTQTFTYEVPGLGTARLRVAMDPAYSTNRRVLIVRSRGMKLFLLARFPSYLNFAAVLDLQGEALNDYFREMESASHDSWDPMRHHDPKGARKQWDALRSWVRTTVRDLGITTAEDEIEAAGQTSLLKTPTEVDQQPEAEPVKKEKKPPAPLVDPETLLAMQPRTQRRTFGGDQTMSLSAAPEAPDDADDSVRVTSRPPRRGSTPAGTDRERSQAQGVRQDPNGRREAVLSEPEGRKRVVRIAPSTFRVFLTVDQKLPEGRVELTYVGENAQAQAVAVNIADLYCDTPTVTFDRRMRRIELHDVHEGQRIQFDVRVSENEDYAMKASIYAYR